MDDDHMDKCKKGQLSKKIYYSKYLASTIKEKEEKCQNTKSKYVTKALYVMKLQRHRKYSVTIKINRSFNKQKVEDKYKLLKTSALVVLPCKIK